jgi:hypothetical protein
MPRGANSLIPLPWSDSGLMHNGSIHLREVSAIWKKSRLSFLEVDIALSLILPDLTGRSRY